jgi:NAD(P)-dependent dehydrogenase (short-subunit alcohol dehydrogenase family)
MSRSAGKAALVTGAYEGPARALLRCLGESGASAVVGYRDKQRRAEEVATAVRAAGADAITHQADITDATSLAAMFGRIRRHFGYLDILVLSASGGLENKCLPITPCVSTAMRRLRWSLCAPAHVQ